MRDILNVLGARVRHFECLSPPAHVASVMMLRRVRQGNMAGEGHVALVATVAKVVHAHDANLGSGFAHDMKKEISQRAPMSEA